jgi:hypothetical protein
MHYRVNEFDFAIASKKIPANFEKLTGMQYRKINNLLIQINEHPL